MSTHPNTILMVALSPHGLTRKTLQAIRDEAGVTEDYHEIKIGGRDYSATVFEGDYDEGYQIASKEGDIVLHQHITYGYGESVTWDELQKAKEELEEWAKGICERHACDYQIRISANYW